MLTLLFVAYSPIPMCGTYFVFFLFFFCCCLYATCQKYCTTLNFRDTNILQICHLGHFCTLNRPIFLHRGGSKLLASFQIIKIGPLLRKLWSFRVRNAEPTPFPTPGDFLRKLSARKI